MDAFPFHELPDDILWAHVIPRMTWINFSTLCYYSLLEANHTFIRKYIFPAIARRCEIGHRTSMGKVPDSALFAYITTYARDLDEIRHLFRYCNVPIDLANKVFDVSLETYERFLKLIITNRVSLDRLMMVTGDGTVPHISHICVKCCIECNRADIMDTLVDHGYTFTCSMVLEHIGDSVANTMIQIVSKIPKAIHAHAKDIMQDMTLTLGGDYSRWIADIDSYEVLHNLCGRLHHMNDKKNRKSFKQLRYYQKVLRIPGFVNFCKSFYNYAGSI